MTSIKYEYNFLAMAFIDGEVRANSYNLTLNLMVKTISPANQQIAFSRMDFAINEVISDSVFVDEDDEETIKKLKNVGLKVLTVPKPGPIDQIVHIVLINKLNAITDDKIIIFESELQSAIGHFVKYVYYSPQDGEDDGLVSQDGKKWWNDKYTRFASITKVSKIANFSQTSLWSELDMHWEADEPDEDDDEDAEYTAIAFKSKQADAKPTNIITLSDFTPDK